MSTFDRFSAAARAQLNALLEKAADGDDRKAYAKLVEDADAATREAITTSKRHVAELTSELVRLRAEAASAEKAAMAALRLGDEEAARDRLSAKLRSEKDAEDAERSIAAERAEVEALEADRKRFAERTARMRGAAPAEDRLSDLKKKLDP